MTAMLTTVVQDEIIAVLRDAAACHATPGGIMVITNCLYPSNSLVRVAVLGDAPYTVSDRGGALDILSSHGVEVKNPSRTLGPYAGPYGLEISNSGEIFASGVDLGFLPAAINLVANASKDAAMLVLEKHRPSPFSEFRDELKFALRNAFADHLTNQFRYVGASNKPHLFDHAVSTKSRNTILISAANEDGNAINSVVVANLDVKLRRDEKILQRIIYDDRLNWRAENLLLLEEGAPVIGYSRVIPELVVLVRR